MAGGDLQENPRRPFGPATALFPVAQRRRADAEHGGELGLRETVAVANQSDFRPSDFERPSWRLLSAKDRASFAHARDKVVKEVVVHRMWTIRQWRRVGQASPDHRVRHSGLRVVGCEWVGEE